MVFLCSNSIYEVGSMHSIVQPIVYDNRSGRERNLLGNSNVWMLSSVHLDQQSTELT